MAFLHKQSHDTVFKQGQLVTLRRQLNWGVWLVVNAGSAMCRIKQHREEWDVYNWQLSPTIVYPDQKRQLFRVVK